MKQQQVFDRSVTFGHHSEEGMRRGPDGGAADGEKPEIVEGVGQDAPDRIDRASQPHR